MVDILYQFRYRKMTLLTGTDHVSRGNHQWLEHDVYRPLARVKPIALGFSSGPIMQYAVCTRSPIREERGFLSVCCT